VCGWLDFAAANDQSIVGLILRELNQPVPLQVGNCRGRKAVCRLRRNPQVSLKPRSRRITVQWAKVMPEPNNIMAPKPRELSASPEAMDRLGSTRCRGFAAELCRLSPLVFCWPYFVIHSSQHLLMPPCSLTKSIKFSVSTPCRKAYSMVATYLCFILLVTCGAVSSIITPA
jgi:hypothetical protein